MKPLNGIFGSLTMSNLLSVRSEIEFALWNIKSTLDLKTKDEYLKDVLIDFRLRKTEQQLEKLAVQLEEFKLKLESL